MQNPKASNWLPHGGEAEGAVFWPNSLNFVAMILRYNCIKCSKFSCVQQQTLSEEETQQNAYRITYFNKQILTNYIYSIYIYAYNYVVC